MGSETSAFENGNLMLVLVPNGDMVQTCRSSIMYLFMPNPFTISSLTCILILEYPSLISSTSMPSH